MDEQNKIYLASLKSLETENYIDRKFYRPIGFKIAYALRNTGITPNFITIVSIFVGIAGAACFFYANNIYYALLGIAGMVAANILDCVDGQLARLTGIKSKIGRILDGIAGDLWFITIYTVLSLRIYLDYGYVWIFGVALFALFSHFTQAALTDYYKTLHLFFVNPNKSTEFELPLSVKARVQQMPMSIDKVFTTIYLYYTKLQSRLTPQLSAMMQQVERNYPDYNIPEGVRVRYRHGSIIVMKCVDLLTFNGRSIPLFLSLLIGHVWLYFLYEALFLNIVLVVARNQHEALCRFFNEDELNPQKDNE